MSGSAELFSNSAACSLLRVIEARRVEHGWHCTCASDHPPRTPS